MTHFIAYQREFDYNYIKEIIFLRNFSHPLIAPIDKLKINHRISIVRRIPEPINNKITPKRLMMWFCDITDILMALERHRFYHININPQSIITTSHHAYLIDCTGITSEHIIVASTDWDFSPPEILQKVLDGKKDIVTATAYQVMWSLGMTILCLIIGRESFFDIFDRRSDKYKLWVECYNTNLTPTERCNLIFTLGNINKRYYNIIMLLVNTLLHPDPVERPISIVSFTRKYLPHLMTYSQLQSLIIPHKPNVLMIHNDVPHDHGRLRLLLRRLPDCESFARKCMTTSYDIIILDKLFNLCQEPPQVLKTYARGRKSTKASMDVVLFLSEIDFIFPLI